jgi:SAM-dependent methyltransferase
VRSLARHVSALQDGNVGLDYDRAGERYRVYADGDVDKLYEFDGQYAYGDQEIWRILGNTLNKLRARGRRELSVLDLGCGPGTWLRRIVGWAGKMGFTRITARGVDLAEAQIRCARLLSQDLARHPEVSLRFETGDIRGPMPEPDGSVDICLCLYGVLNHLPADDLPAVFAEVARVTKGKFVATVRAIGSAPTIYVDGVKAAKAYHQDNVHGRLQVEFLNGRRTSFPSRLFSAAEMRALATAALEIEELSGLDLFHARFATDPNWNPAQATPDPNFVHALRMLEHRFRRNPTFIDHATHLLLIARPKRSEAALARVSGSPACRSTPSVLGDSNHQVENFRSTVMRKRMRRAGVV